LCVNYGKENFPRQLIFRKVFMSLGERLRQERERLGLSQPKFAAIASTSKQTLFSWESGKTAPDGFQLAALRAAGVDISYVVAGEHQGSGLGEPAVHRAVLDAIDLLSLEKKVDAQQLAKAVVKLCAKSAPSPALSQAQYSQVVNGNDGQVSQHGDIHVGEPKGGGSRK
jgi:transcriptional regulator with XRE-family HTH domain